LQYLRLASTPYLFFTTYLQFEFKQREALNPDKWRGYRIWVKPKNFHVYAIGADVAEGVGRDASVAQVIDCNTGELVCNYWNDTADIDNFSAELFKLGHYYLRAHICIEQNNHGNGVIAHMGAAHGGLAYPNLYRRYVLDEYTQKRTRKIGFKTNQQTKPPIIENLKSALRDGELISYDRLTNLELMNFVRDERGRMAAAGNAKDDRVMALALAWEQARILRDNQQHTRKSESFTQEYDPSTGFPI
jgi:hypothetical protein